MLNFFCLPVTEFSSCHGRRETVQDEDRLHTQEINIHYNMNNVYNTTIATHSSMYVCVCMHVYVCMYVCMYMYVQFFLDCPNHYVNSKSCYELDTYIHDYNYMPMNIIIHVPGLLHVSIHLNRLEVSG